MDNVMDWATEVVATAAIIEAEPDLFDNKFRDDFIARMVDAAPAELCLRAAKMIAEEASRMQDKA